jgi:hypothetical protein
MLGLLQDLVQRYHYNQIAEAALDAQLILDEIERTYSVIEESLESVDTLRNSLAPKLSSLISTAVRVNDSLKPEILS